MHITVNGVARTVAEGIDLLALLELLGLKPQATVVELNGAVLDRAQHGQTALAEGDVLELVRFVGGG